MRDDAVLRRALPLGRGLGRSLWRTEIFRGHGAAQRPSGLRDDDDDDWTGPMRATVRQGPGRAVHVAACIFEKCYNMKLFCKIL